MTIRVFLDTNVWDFLFDQNLDLCALLPRDQFRICTWPEGEMEIEGVPAELRAFIEDTIARCGVQTIPYFGFPDPNLPRQKVGGFDGKSEFRSSEEKEFMEAFPLGPSDRPSGLKPKEADRALAARSYHSVVLTYETKKKKKRSGRTAFKDASKLGWKVLRLEDYDVASGQSLSDFIKTAQRLSNARA